ncbi:MAG: DNA repair protein RecN [Alphaproteobacteria bacterium]|nr:DNA repair protein RecN [Alphaproteobacteria bacterium]
MLSSLSIRDVVLIDKLDLAFEAGIVTLTGETGAGKSILLDALGLALGARADAAMVRAGAERASVTAVFDVPADHPARAIAAEQGLDAEGELILRRVVGADGRSRAFVNDQPGSVGLLRALGATLVEIHGQFETQGLLDAATHRAALDSFRGLGARASEAARLHAAWRGAAAAAETARAELARAAGDADFLRHVVAELDALAPRPGEERELADRRALLASGEKLAEALRAALDELSAQKGVEGALRAARRQLERLAPRMEGRLDAALGALDRAAAEAADAVAEVEALARGIELDPAALERVEERLFALKAAARKHRVEIDALDETRARFASRLAAIDEGDGRLVALDAAAASARAAYAQCAGSLGAARAEGAAALDEAVAGELPALRLDKARFRTRLEALEERDWGPGGRERVVFEVATNPGSEPGPLARIASGGELSRFMLALKAVLARGGEAGTLVFDELDSGVGGATAAAIGERLARLGRSVQLLVVTHSPQVAARGTLHLRVAKRTERGRAITSVERLEGAERREELARMLSGATVTDAARAAADALLEPPAAPARRRGARA